MTVQGPALRMDSVPADQLGQSPRAQATEAPLRRDSRDRPGRIWGLVAIQASLSWRKRVSCGCVHGGRGLALEVTGAWLVAAAGAEAGHLMRVTDEVSEHLAELEADPGRRTGRLMRPLQAERRWPRIWAPARPLAAGRRSPSAAMQAGAGAIFAFPLRIGAIRTGVLGLYRARPGPLTAFQLGDALVFAGRATLLLLEARTRRRAAVTRRLARAASPPAWPCIVPRSTRLPGC